MVEDTAAFTFRNEAEDAPRMRRFVARWLRDAPLAETEQADLLLAVTEAINNACQHAGADGGALEISCYRSGERIAVSVADNGCGFSPGTVALDQEPPLDRTTGRGLFLMRHLTDDVTIVPTVRGTKVTLVRHSRLSHVQT